MLDTTSFSECQADQFRDAQIDAATHGMLHSDVEYETVMEKRGLWKRAITGAAKGMAAVAKFLTGATKVATSSKTFRAYRKNGNYETTLQDFYSVEPRLTKAKQFGRTTGFDFGRRRDSHGSLIGTVGDRRLSLRPNGDWYSRHSPVLEIRSITNAEYGRIVYKTKGD